MSIEFHLYGDITVADLRYLNGIVNITNNLGPNPNAVLLAGDVSLTFGPEITTGMREVIAALANALGNLTPDAAAILVVGPDAPVVSAPPITSPAVNNFPADPTQAPTSPEGSEQIVLNGAVDGPPYLKDAQGNIHQLKIVNGANEYWLNGASMMAGWSAHADAPPVKLLVAQGGVYVFLADGITQAARDGSFANAVVPPPFVSGSTGTPGLPALPAMPIPSAISPGSSGKIIQCGSGQALATLSAAIPTAGPGDTIQLAPGTYTDTPSVWTVPLLIDLGGATFDATGQTAMLARGKGLLVPAADSIIQNGTILNVAMDQTEGQLTSAIRPDAGCGFLTIKNVVAHENQCGVGEGGIGGNAIAISDSDVSNNGLKANAGANTHNIYIGQDCVQLTLTNVVSNGCNDAHALKYRGPVLIVNGGTFAAFNGSCIDLPNGSTKPFSVTNAALLKAPTDSDHVIISYGLEGATNGTAGGTINGGTIAALCPNPLILTAGGTITATGVMTTGGTITAVTMTGGKVTAVTMTGGKITAQGGGTIVGF